MNSLFISGKIIGTPVLLNEQSDINHLVLNLGVRHKTKAGVIRTEIYRVSAWNNIARWGEKNLMSDQVIVIRGYLTQRRINLTGVTAEMVEIVAEEFLVNPRPAEIGAKAPNEMSEQDGPV